MFTDGIPKSIPLNDAGGAAFWKTKLDMIKDGLTKFGNKKKRKEITFCHLGQNWV